MKDKKLDKEVSGRILKLIEKYNLDRSAIADTINIKISSFNDVLAGKSPWRLTFLSKLCMYFGVSIDEVVFGDKNYVEKQSEIMDIEFRKKIFKYLKDNKRYEAFGRLAANGFFDKIKN